LTNDCTTSSGVGAGLVSWLGAHDGMVMAMTIPGRDYLNYLTGLVVTFKIILLVTNGEPA